MLVCIQQGDREHACGFLTSDSSRFVQDGHQPFSIAFRCTSARKRHGVG